MPGGTHVHQFSKLMPFGTVPGVLGYSSRCACGELCAAMALGVDYISANAEARDCAFALAKQLFGAVSAPLTEGAERSAA